MTLPKNLRPPSRATLAVLMALAWPLPSSAAVPAGAAAEIVSLQLSLIHI